MTSTSSWANGFRPIYGLGRMPRTILTGICQKTGKTFDELCADGGLLYDPDFTYHRHEKGLLRSSGEPGFNTPTGKDRVVFRRVRITRLRAAALLKGATGQSDKHARALRGIPARVHLGRTPHLDLPFRAQAGSPPARNASRSRVLVHPNDAEKYGIRDGEWVWIENQRGKARQKARVTNTIMEGVVNADHGWWFPEEDLLSESLWRMEGKRQSADSRSTVGRAASALHTRACCARFIP